MLSYEFIVWLLFRLIDSLILIILGGWLFVYKILPSVRKKIAKEHEQKDELLREVNDLEKRANDLDQQLIVDMHVKEELEQHMRLWHQALKRKQNRLIAEKQDIAIRLTSENKHRTKIIERQKQYTSVVLDALDQAEHILMQDKDSLVIEKIMQYMSSLQSKEQA